MRKEMGPETMTASMSKLVLAVMAPTAATDRKKTIPATTLNVT
jgi:hypothetical protein